MVLYGYLAPARGPDAGCLRLFALLVRVWPWGI